MREIYKDLSGVLPDSVIRMLVADGHIAFTDTQNVGSSSLDVTLATEAYRVKELTRPQKGQSIRDLLKKVSSSAHSISDPLEPDGVYIFCLNERLSLPRCVYGFANPKSTTGRDDIHVRLLADNITAYDTIPRGYKGELWLEVRPMSFYCKVQKGLPLAQFRFFTKDTRIRSRDDMLAIEEKEGPLLFSPEGDPINVGDNLADDGSLLLSLYLPNGIVGYESNGTNEVLDLSAVGTVDPDIFFTPKKVSKDLLYLKKNRFYILSSYERVRVPIDYACEMRPMDDRLGEVRVHYAGYIDDGWGGEKGAMLTLEVRAYEDMYIQAKQPIARIVFERMARRADKPYTEKTSNYVNQHGPQLAKHFTKSPD